MYIVQTECSSKIVKTGKVEYTRIAPSKPGGVPWIDFFTKQSLNLTGDPRLERLVGRLRREIAKNDWRVPQNEKEICEETVRLIHSNKYFGAYAATVTNDRQQLKNHDSMTHLKDFKNGELICKQEAAITSYALHKVGIQNDYCAGESADTNNGMINGHAFVQTKSGNIVEATDPVNPYGQTFNHKMVRDGNIAMVRFAPGYGNAYGGGNMNALQAIGYTFSDRKTQVLREQVQKNLEGEIKGRPEGMTKALETARKYLQPLKHIDGVHDDHGSPRAPITHTGLQQVIREL